MSGKILRPTIQNVAKRISLEHNVSLQVLDASSGKIIQEHTGHNAATDSLLTGIGRYLLGDGVLNQGSEALSRWVPKYISLGTMGLYSQEADADGLPAGVGVGPDISETNNFIEYMIQVPGYGSNGYDSSLINGRPYFGLGPIYENREFESTVNCELISLSAPRCKISYRDTVPETESEYPETIDVVFSALIPTGALAQFRPIDPVTGERSSCLFITEAGLWSQPTWSEPPGDNGLLAGYRITPPNRENWVMDPTKISDNDAEAYKRDHPEETAGMTLAEVKEYMAEQNRLQVKRNILRVGVNQVVQVVWKIQLGGLAQLSDIGELYPEKLKLYWQEF